MVGGGACAGPQGPQRIMVVDPIDIFYKFHSEKMESVDNHLDIFDDYLEYNELML